MDLFDAAMKARENAYAPYSNFKVGSALETESGAMFYGCNVENVAFPEGTCAEAGAIAAMVAAGERKIARLIVVADGPDPVAPCGGCRQKIVEFSEADTVVTLAGLDGSKVEMRVADLLPCAFTKKQLEG